ncbi:MAG: hypothetical protein NWE93_03365 [Candidatus Bathyarchaeota archaeon]|nr:hypothetical protein [Candidatus Bathyarchaeota archaeon]
MGTGNNLRNFDEVLTQAIDQALLAIGEPVKEIICYHIQTKYSLKPDDISKQPDLFVCAMRNLLGAGSTYIEELILKKVCESYGLDCCFTVGEKFEDSIKLIQQKISK